MNTRLLVPAFVALGLLLAPVSRAAASPHTSYFRGSGWSLTLTTQQASYGSILHGRVKHSGHSFQVEGDWIPAGDAGGDLLRFYGPAIGAQGPMGLISLATLYNTCNPDCATSKIYALRAVAGWRLPGTQAKSVRLVFQGYH